MTDIVERARSYELGTLALQNERLRAEKIELLKQRNSEEMQRMIDYWGKRAEKAEAEIERLRAVLSRIAKYQHAGAGMGQLAEMAQEALNGH